MNDQYVLLERSANYSPHDFGHSFYDYLPPSRCDAVNIIGKKGNGQKDLHPDSRRVKQAARVDLRTKRITAVSCSSIRSICSLHC